MADLRFGVLGALQVCRGPEEILLGSRRERALLAILLLRVGSPVPRQEIIDLLWVGDPPPSGVNLVHTYIGRLRTRLDPHRVGPDRTAWLVRIGSAYQIQPDHCDIDLLRFQSAVARTRTAVRPADRLRLLVDALGLWRGPCLAGLEALSGHPRVRAVDQERTNALLEAGRLACEIAEVAEVVPLLREAAAADPLNEAVHACLITALATAGVQVQALAEYEAIRARLTDQLGVHPGPELREAHLRVLRQEIRPARQEIAAVGPRPELPPMEPADFTGYAVLHDRLQVVLTDDRDRRRANVAAITGRGGAGKTVLARQVASQSRDFFPGGQVYVDLKGSGAAPLAPAQVLSRVLRAVGAGEGALPEDLDERAELYRSQLAGRRLLIVLDDARNARQLSWLLPAPPGTAVLMTSRDALRGLPVAHRFEVDGLDDQDATRLLARLVGPAVTDRDPAMTAELVRLCEGWPLALCAAGARLAARPHWTVADLVDRMSAPERRLDELAHGDLDPRASLRSAYGRLAGPPARMFRLLGLLEVPTFAPWLAAALGEANEAEAARMLAGLSAHHLIEAAGADLLGQPRYRFRTLPQLYARELARETESNAEARAAVTRGLTTALTLARDAGDRLRDLPPGGRSALPWASASGGVRSRILLDPAPWLRSEATCLLALTLQAAALGLDDLAWHLGVRCRQATGLIDPPSPSTARIGRVQSDL